MQRSWGILVFVHAVPDIVWSGESKEWKGRLTEEIQKHQPDIVITDIQMPILSGLDMIAQARENGLGGRYLILSGYGEFQYAQSALRLGVEDYLLKPIDPDDLELQLKSLTEKVAQGKENDFAAYVRQWFNLDIRQGNRAAAAGRGLLFHLCRGWSCCFPNIRRVQPGCTILEGEYLCVVGSNTGEVENPYRTFYR